MQREVFRDQVAIVTGASSGIGRALALQLAGQGAKLVLAARRAELLEEFAQPAASPGARRWSYLPTLPKRPSASRWSRRPLQRLAGWMLINNAGLAVIARPEDFPDLSLFKHTMEVNFYGAVYCPYYALPHLIRSRGRIVAVSSLRRKAPAPYNSPNVASKFAMHGFFDSLRIEKIKFGGSERSRKDPGWNPERNNPLGKEFTYVCDKNPSAKCKVSRFPDRGRHHEARGEIAATDELLSLCHIEDAKEFLNVGCGIGVGVAYIARKFVCRVVGVDISEKMSEWSRLHAGEEKVEDKVEFRFGWPHQIPLWLQMLGLAGMVLGMAFSSWAMVANPFFAALVRIQTDRGHTVVSAGPYRIMRHPGYAGGLLADLSFPFLLGCLWAQIPIAIVLVLIIFRTVLEDRTLQAELPGYRECAARVRYRLLPGIW